MRVEARFQRGKGMRVEARFRRGKGMRGSTLPERERDAREGAQEVPIWWFMKRIRQS